MQNGFNFSPLQRNLISIIVILVLTLIFFWRVPVQGRVLLPLDVLHTYEPWRSEIPGALGIRVWNPWLSDGVRYYNPLLNLVRASWRQGEVPFWNPYALAGMPVLASGLNQVFYPPSLLLLLTMPTAQAMSWGTISHAFLGSLFCFLFIRELGAGHFGALSGAISFIFGALIYWIPALPTFQAIIWLPLLFWALERGLRRRDWRWAVVGGVILGFQLLAGNLQMAYYSLTGLSAYALYRGWLDWLSQRNLRAGFRPLIFLVLLVLIGIGMAAIQLLPTIELLPWGVRGEVDFNPDFSARILLRLFVPDILGTDLDRNLGPGFSHELYLYFGLFPLLFLIAAAFSPYRSVAWYFIGLGLLVWFVIFKVPPFYQIFATLYPSFSVLGFHRAQVLIAFAWAVAAGLGADWIHINRPVPFLKWLILIGGTLLAIITVYALWLAFLSKYQARFWWNLPSVEEMKPTAIYVLTSLIFSGVILTASLAILWQWQQAKIGQTVFGIGVLAIIVIDVFLVHLDYVPAGEVDMLYPQTRSLAHLKNLTTQETQPYRFISVERLFWGNDATVFSLNDIQGYDPFLMKRYSVYVDLTGARLDTNHRIAAFSPRTSRLIDALNVKYYYIPRHKLTDGEWVSLLSEVDNPLVQSEHLSGEQVAEWIIDGWPQRVLLAPPDSKITYQGFLPYPSQLETAIAIDPDVWDQPRVDILFAVYGRSASSPAETLLFSKHLVQTQPDEMHWVPVVVDLSDFTGQQITLSFVTSASDPEASWGAGWADPLIMDHSKVELVYYGPNSIYLNKNHLPRAWVVHQVTQVTQGDLEAVEAVLASPDFDLAEQAAIEGTLSEPLSPKIKDEPVEFIIYTPSYSKLTAELATPGLLTMSDIYYPGWKVYVDGVERLLYATNLVMRGVYVPDGTHTIEFVYEPLSYKIGLYTSLGTVALVAISLILDWRLKRRDNQAEDCR